MPLETAKTVKGPEANPESAFMKPVRPGALAESWVQAAPADRDLKIGPTLRRTSFRTPGRRNINADAALLPVFGGKKQVTMFEMTNRQQAP
jgi:hypothetical protein